MQMRPGRFTAGHGLTRTDGSVLILRKQHPPYHIAFLSIKQQAVFPATRGLKISDGSRLIVQTQVRVELFRI